MLLKPSFFLIFISLLSIVGIGCIEFNPTSTPLSTLVDGQQEEEEETIVVGEQEEEDEEQSTLTTDDTSTKESTIQHQSIIQETPQSTDSITRNYMWLYGATEWTWELQIPQSLHDDYKGIPRPYTENYSIYVTHPWDDMFIEDLVSSIVRVSEEEGFSELEKIEFTTTFVQSLPYTADSVTTPYDEYPRYPIETLVDGGGDCEDTSILLASLLNEMGYSVILIQFQGVHAAVGILGEEGISGYFWEYEGGRYYYIETTNTGWGIGDCPEELQSASAYLYGMRPIPILTHDWSAASQGSIAELDVIVENLGTAIADDVYIHAGLDAGNDLFWNIEESELFDIGIDGRVTVRLYLQIPLGRYTRIWVQIIDDGYCVDESYSEWFNT